ncbi:MAG: hypothetical protein LBM13_01780 [Candidatus Ancillula sp.]|nr:hypothetical protein [Candidatus Ancillula sp.]
MHRVISKNDGTATIFTIGLICISSFLLISIIFSVNFLILKKRVKIVAEQAALAGAEVVYDGGNGCQIAEIIAKKNNSNLAECVIKDEDIIVSVKSLKNEFIFGNFSSGIIFAKAKAGPSELSCP